MFGRTYCCCTIPAVISSQKCCVYGSHLADGPALCSNSGGGRMKPRSCRDAMIGKTVSPLRELLGETFPLLPVSSSVKTIGPEWTVGTTRPPGGGVASPSAGTAAGKSLDKISDSKLKASWICFYAQHHKKGKEERASAYKSDTRPDGNKHNTSACSTGRMVSPSTRL